MELIKNLGAGKNVMNPNTFCSTCYNRGRIKRVQECDREKFDMEFDRLDALGTMDNFLVYDRAIEGCRFDYYYCPMCEEGQKYKDRYPMYLDSVTYIHERERLYSDILECRQKLKDAEEKELQFMKDYSKEKYKELAVIQREVNELSQKYVDAKERFMNFVREND